MQIVRAVHNGEENDAMSEMILEKWDCSNEMHDPEWDGNEWRCTACMKQLNTTDKHARTPSSEFERGKREMLSLVLDTIEHQLSKKDDYEHSETWECALRLLKGRVKHLQ